MFIFSIGILIPELFLHHSPKQRLDALHVNSIQILDVYEANTKETEVIELDRAVKLRIEWMTAHINGTHFASTLDFRAKKLSELYISAMRAMTNKLTKAMSLYDDYALNIGMCLLVQSLLGAVYVHLNLVSGDKSLFFFIYSSFGLPIFCLASGFTAYIHVHLCSMQSLGMGFISFHYCC